VVLCVCVCVPCVFLIVCVSCAADVSACNVCECGVLNRFGCLYFQQANTNAPTLSHNIIPQNLHTNLQLSPAVSLAFFVAG